MSTRKIPARHQLRRMIVRGAGRNDLTWPIDLRKRNKVRSQYRALLASGETHEFARRAIGITLETWR